MPATSPRPLRLFASCLLIWLLAYVVCALFLAVAELREPFAALPGLDPVSGAYVILGGTVSALWILQRARRLRRREAAGVAPAALRAELRSVFRALPALVLFLLSVGALGSIGRTVLADAVPLAAWGPADLALILAGVLLVFASIVLPLGLLCLDEFGLAFGHLVGDEPVVSMWLRVSPGFVMVVMIGTAMVLQESLRSGRPDAAPLVLLATMIPYALLIMVLNARYTAHALDSVRGFLEAIGARRRVTAPDLRVESLDQIGVLVGQVRELVRQREASEARLRSFAEAASDFYFETDAQTRLIWLSERAEAVTGLAPEALAGRAFATVAAELGIEVPQDQAELVRARQPFRDLVVALPGAMPRHLRISAVPVQDDAGRFLGYRGVATDVTEVALAEARLRDREAQLARAQRMEAVGELTGGVAHDFNNLLLVVAGNLELAREENDPGERRALLDAALGASRRGASLVQHLLAFSRRQVLRPEALDLPVRFETLAELLRTTLGAGIELKLELGPDLDPPLVDAAQFESALLHLALNARDAMPDGGRLCVRAANRRLVGGEHDLAPGDYVEVRVEDTGVGMPEAVRERVFEPFFGTRAGGEGTGLGLSMVYGFVNQSRGAVDVQSTPGLGTTITLLLPVARERPEAPVRRESRGERLLLIEDEPEVRRAVTAGLEAAGYEVASAPDGDVARRLVDAGLEFDLALADQVLPGHRSGVAILAELREARPQLPALLMSGYADDHLPELPAALADVELVAKPFRMRELLARLDRLLERPAKAGRLRLVGGGAGEERP